MHPILLNSLAVLAGLVVGNVINMGIVMISGSVIPPPEGADVTTAEGLQASIHLFEAKHYIFPFLAHALGTFFGALVAALIGVNRKLTVAMIIGGFFLIGGILAAVMIPASPWFVVIDLLLAYLPMAWLGARIVLFKKRMKT